MQRQIVRRALAGASAAALLIGAPALALSSSASSTSGVDASVGAAADLLVGAGSVDTSWHIGAPAGQYADMVEPDALLTQEWDPNVQHVTKQSSYAMQTRLLAKALVLQSKGGQPIALVKQDAYLSQDYLSRRVADILKSDGSKVTYDNIMISSTHDHSAPYYTTPSAGVWVFEDVMDLRQFEYQAQAIAESIEDAERSMRPAKMSATQIEFPDFQSNIQGPGVADDGSPAGYPREENDHTLAVMRFDELRSGKSIATWMNYAQHGEELDGYNIMSADFLGVLQAEVEEQTGGTLVFTQGAVGSSEGPYEGWYPGGEAPKLSDGTRKVFGHAGFAQMHRGAHLLADAVLKAWNEAGSGKGLVGWSTNPVVKMYTRWTPGPLSHPYPGVSNCRTEPTLRGNVGLPVAGLPDCERADLPEVTSPLYDNLKLAGLPLPANYDGTSFAAVEENLRLKLQAVRIGEVFLGSCACEPQADLIKNIETRTDVTQGNEWLGYDWSPQCTPKGSGSAKQWICPDPRDYIKNEKKLTVSDAAYQRMRAHVLNDAKGWNDPGYVVQANSEPSDPTLIKGNFTHAENPPALGYTLTVGLGHTSDYNGYTVSYREYMARDGYRKALTSYGAHTADYMATRLTSMAAFLKGGPALPAEPTDAINAVDEQRQTAESKALGVLSSFYYSTWARTLPADGPAAIVSLTPAIKRFGAATLSWTGGNNYADNPTVRIERLVGRTWQPYADQLDGAVVTSYARPADEAANVQSLLTSRLPGNTHQWFATFEAYDAWPKGNLEGGQTPAGTYRYVVDGRRSDSLSKGTVPYHLESASFTVAAWNGIQAPAVQRLSNGDVKLTPVKIEYPKTYKAPGLPTVGDDGQRWICRTCSTMPWAVIGHTQSIQVAVQRNGKTVRTVEATIKTNGTSKGAETWVADTNLAKGETAIVLPGAVRDGYNETNLKASARV